MDVDDAEGCAARDLKGVAVAAGDNVLLGLRVALDRVLYVGQQNGILFVSGHGGSDEYNFSSKPLYRILFHGRAGRKHILRRARIEGSARTGEKVGAITRLP